MSACRGMGGATSRFVPLFGGWGSNVPFCAAIRGYGGSNVPFCAAIRGDGGSNVPFCAAMFRCSYIFWTGHTYLSILSRTKRDVALRYNYTSLTESRCTVPLFLYHNIKYIIKVMQIFFLILHFTIIPHFNTSFQPLILTPNFNSSFQPLIVTSHLNPHFDRQRFWVGTQMQKICSKEGRVVSTLEMLILFL